MSSGACEAMGQKKHDHKNAKRDLVRKLLKGSAWPKPYEMRLPVWSLAQQQEGLFLCLMHHVMQLHVSCVMQVHHREFAFPLLTCAMQSE